MYEELLDIDCACGQRHSLATRDFIMEKDGMAKLRGLLRKLKLDKRPLAVFDTNTYKAAFPKLDRCYPGLETFVIPGTDIHADEASIGAVSAAYDGHSALLAVGSGVVNDVVRYVAHHKNVPFVSVPTAASVDGYPASGAVVTLKGAKATLPAAPPVAVVADLEVVAAAPPRLAASGVGDMMSKFLSIPDWLISHLTTGSFYCPFTAKLSLDAACAVVKNADGIAKGDMDSIGVLLDSLNKSGLVIQIAGVTQPASSFEHHFSHYLDGVPLPANISSAMHGEQVGVASIIAAKYYPVFTRLLERIFRENLPNKFSSDRIRHYYAQYPKGIVNALVELNTPSISYTFRPDRLKAHYAEILEAADGIPSPGVLRDAIRKVGGMTDYRELGMTPAQFRQIMESCCYIRNRFTVLRIVCDYELFDFGTMDD